MDFGGNSKELIFKIRYSLAKEIYTKSSNIVSALAVTSFGLLHIKLMTENKHSL